MLYKKICIITPGYIASTPRVVKEADALFEAGFDVRVVCSQGNLDYMREHDSALLTTRPWRCQMIGWSPRKPNERLLYYKSKYRYHLIRRLPSLFWEFGKLAEHGEGRIYPELAKLASSEKADLYIGHYPTGLAAAAFAATWWNTKLAYDVEDLHIEEVSANYSGTKKRISIIEQRYTSRCSYITTVSDLIADKIQKLYKVTRPTAVYNVFPLDERNEIDGAVRDRQGEPLSLYWYSQTIGLDRGIQDAIRAMGLVKGKVQLHLRGTLSVEVKEALENLAQENGIANSLYFHPKVPPNELLSRAVEHDVGLALEPGFDANNRNTASNKLFFYLVAGICVIVTNVPGQQYIMKHIPETGFIYAPGDFHTLANHLQLLLDDPLLLKQKKEAALAAAQKIWNWENESQKLVRLVSQTLQS